MVIGVIWYEFVSFWEDDLVKTDTHMENVTWRWRVGQGTPRTSGKLRSWAKGPGQIVPQSPWVNTALPTPWSWTCGLQKSVRFCCKSPTSWCFYTRAEGKECKQSYYDHFCLFERGSGLWWLRAQTSVSSHLASCDFPRGFSHVENEDPKTLIQRVIIVVV